MTNDVKHIFENMDWPEPRADLRARIIDGIENNGFAPWMLLNSARARVGLMFSLIMCLVAGFVLESGTVQRHRNADMAITSVGLAYYLRT